MKIHCHKCRTNYTIPEDTVPAHLSRSTCRKCGTPFVFFVTPLPESAAVNEPAENDSEESGKPAVRQ